MKIRKILSLTFLALCICSCSESKDVDEVSLKGQLVKLDEGETGRYSIHYLFRDMAYVHDYGSFDLSVGKMSPTGLQKLEKTLVRGHGHNEFQRAALSQDKNGALYVLNRPMDGDKLMSLTKIPNASNAETIKDQTKWEDYNFNKLPPVHQFGDSFIVMSDSTILITGAPSKDMKHVFSIVNFKSQTITPLDGYWPEDGSPADKIYYKLFRYTYYSGITWNGKDKFLYWNGWIPLTFIFTIDGAKMNIQSYMYNKAFQPDVNYCTERLHCCTDGDRIYVLYADSDEEGKKLDGFNEKCPFPMGNTVEVYDWDGVKQQVIHLDKLGREIRLSEDGNTLYLSPGDTSHGDEYIYSYKVR